MVVNQDDKDIQIQQCIYGKQLPIVPDCTFVKDISSHIFNYTISCQQFISSKGCQKDFCMDKAQVYNQLVIHLRA